MPTTCVVYDLLSFGADVARLAVSSGQPEEKPPIVCCVRIEYMLRMCVLTHTRHCRARKQMRDRTETADKRTVNWLAAW